MKNDLIFSPVAALANSVKAHPDTRQVVMSEAAWTLVMEDALRTIFPAEIVNNHDGERLFNGVPVLLYSRP